MQLQLSLKVADRLHEMILVRGEPLEAFEAARLLLASPQVPAALCYHVLGALVAQDRRFCWDSEEARRLSLRRWELPDPHLEEVPFVALDLETTGSKPGISKITEIGAVRIEGLREVARFSTLVNPMRPIPPMIARLTGITQEMVAQAPRIEEVLPELLDFLQGAVVVAHNAPFDVGFLNYELSRLKGRRLGEGAIDTLPLSRALIPGLPNYRLGTVAEAFDAPVAACHRALADAQAVHHVFVGLVDLLQQRGITRLEEIRALANPALRLAVQKLPLTRHLPRKTGTYRFVGKNGQTLYIGRANRLGDEVRSCFLRASSLTRGIRQAIEAVELIEWQEAATPLEALVEEYRQLLEHRPAFNAHLPRPESYTYLKVRSDQRGLLLTVARRSPRQQEASRSRRTQRDGSLVLGPFRSRNKLRSALHILQECYPIRRCAARSNGHPCQRGQLNQCLAPCTGDPAVTQNHDWLVTEILSWLAGDLDTRLPDPLEQIERKVARAAHEGRRNQAERLAQAAEHLLSIRRSYLSLLEARELRFAALWPVCDKTDTPTVRVNVVWEGLLVEATSLRSAGLEKQVEELLARLWQVERTRPDTGPLSPTRGSRVRAIAVSQDQLDLMLAIRRWIYETDNVTKVSIPGPEASPEHKAHCRAELVRHARELLPL